MSTEKESNPEQYCNRKPACGICIEFAKEYEIMLEKKKAGDIDQLSIDYWIDSWHYTRWELNH